MGRKPTNAISIYSLISDHDQRYNICIVWTLYGLDKWRAMTRQWRVREKKLIILALIGGSIGALIGMTVFHHKTRKWYFRLGIPLILGIQVSLVLCFYDMI